MRNVPTEDLSLVGEEKKSAICMPQGNISQVQVVYIQRTVRWGFDCTVCFLVLIVNYTMYVFILLCVHR